MVGYARLYVVGYAVCGALCQVTSGGNLVSADPLPGLSQVRVDQKWKLHKI